MQIPMTPSPLAWCYGSVSVRQVAVLIFVLHTSVHACCIEEQGPITNCSFLSGQNLFSCDVFERGNYLGTCPDESIADIDSIPPSILVDEFSIEPYYTSCMPTDEYDRPQLQASSCHSPCHEGHEAVHMGLNISFKVDPWSAEDVLAISISLRHGASNNVRCVTLRFGTDQLSYAAAEQHVFYYDGFIGLTPGQTYTVNVLTLPTNNNWSNNVYKTITMPYETCWVPDLKFHDTPFAVNLTLFQDVSYNFTMFNILLRAGSDHTRLVDFNNVELLEMDGKWGTNVIFECIEPSEVKVYVEAKDCPFCHWKKTETYVKAAPPTFYNCPEHDIIHKVELGQFKRDDIIANVNWSIPTPVFQSQCMSDFNSTHSPLIDTFRVGRTTPVTYYAWQFSSMAECTFNVKVITVDTTPPELSCPANIHATAQPKMKEMKVNFDTPQIQDSSDTNLYMIIKPDAPFDGNVHHFPVNINSSVTYLVKDTYNNSAKCNFYIYVEETPSASPLVIILSCVAGLLLIMILAFVIWKAANKREKNTDFQEKHDEKPCHQGFTRLTQENFGECIPMHVLQNFQVSESSIANSFISVSCNPKYPERSKSEPSIPQPSSGYHSFNDIERESFIPSIGHPRPTRLESVEEEEVRMRNGAREMDSSEDDGSLYGSQYSGSFDDSPVSLESTC